VRRCRFSELTHTLRRKSSLSTVWAELGSAGSLVSGSVPATPHSAAEVGGGGGGGGGGGSMAAAAALPAVSTPTLSAVGVSSIPGTPA